MMIHLEKYHAITIKQAYRMFFNELKSGYDMARKRLKLLEDRGMLQSYLNSETDEKVYYYEHKISAHDLYILDFYSMLMASGCSNIEFIKNPEYLKGLINPDGFFSFEYNENLYFMLLEVDLTHKTRLSKFQLYEKLYKDGELKEQCFGTFPILVVMGFDNCLKYESLNFEIVYSDFSLSNFESKVLGIA